MAQYLIISSWLERDPIIYFVTITHNKHAAVDNGKSKTKYVQDFFYRTILKGWYCGDSSHWPRNFIIVHEHGL